MQHDWLTQPHTRKQFLRNSGVLAASATLLGACGDDDDAAPASTSAPTSWAEVEAAAEKEGTVTLYQFNSDTVDAISSGFREAYPWAEVKQYVAGAPAELQARVLSEKRAGRPGADVVHLTPFQEKDYRAGDAIVPVEMDMPNADSVPENYRDDERYMYGWYQVPAVVPWNNRELSSPPPSDLFELAQPEFKGLMGTDNPSNQSVGYLLLVSRREVWGDEKWKEWLTGLKSNEMRSFASGGAAYDAVRRGELNLAFGAYNDIQSQDPGTPVEAGWYPEVVAFVSSVALATDAPHPNTALLLLNWLISPEGAAMMGDSGRMPVVPAPGVPTLEDLVPSDLSIMPQTKLTEYLDNPADYVQIMCDYLSC